MKTTAGTFEAFRPRFSFLAGRAAPTLLATVLGVFLVAVPMARSSEFSERTAPCERSEEDSIVHRCERARQIQIDSLRDTPLRAVAFIPNVGHAQRPDLAPPSGHRLANGLLAPMTC